MKRLNLNYLIIAMIGIGVLVSCKKDKVTGVELNRNTLTLLVGNTETLRATVLPAAATNKTVSWKSSNNMVATVDDGKVTAIAEGSATITVTTKDGNKTASCALTVNNIQPIEMEMIWVEGGTFTMGCTDDQCSNGELPPHQVTVSSFMIAQYPVTQRQWVAVMGKNISSVKGNYYPVEMVSWDDTQEFIRRLNTATGKNYRLPTEAEWEYAARGGNQSMEYKYSGSDSLNKVGWYVDNKDTNKIRPVGMKSPNELGIYDMSGNVWEWCGDWHGAYTATPQTDPTGPATGSYRVLRGGSWRSTARDCRVATRYYNYSPPTHRDIDIGFRLVLVP